MESSFLTEANKAEWPDSAKGIKHLYDDWAKTYDVELKQYGYRAPVVTVETLAKWVPNKEARVMDIACGTGLTGEELIKAGYSSIDGVDLSTESIKLCKQKNIYGRLLCSDIHSDRSDIDNDVYDATVCVGCFVPAHMDEKCFPELARITKSGGFILITMREAYLDITQDYNYGGKFETGIQNMVQQGKWEVVTRDPVEGYYGENKGVTLVFKML